MIDKDKILQYIFYFIVFIVFYNPVNDAYHIEIFGVKLALSEIAFLALPFINLLIERKYSQEVCSEDLKRIVVIFFFYIVSVSFIKDVIYIGSFGDFTKSLRLSLPLISSFTILLSGLRVDIKKLWRIILIAVLLSNMIAISAFLFHIERFLPPKDNLTRAGRLFNSNFEFSIIALFLLFESKKFWYNKGFLPIITSVFSLLGLIMHGNRTFLIAVFLSSLYFTFTKFSLSILVRSSIILLIVGFTFIMVYLNVDVLKRQVDLRILPLVMTNEYVFEDAYYNNRDFIVDGVIEKIDQGYWLIGLPYSKPIFSYNMNVYRISGRDKMVLTDTSLVNLLLRYGILALILFSIIFFRLFVNNLHSANPSRIFLYTTPFYFLTSINVDSFVSHNLIFFLIIVLFVRRVN